jgi:outer membrane protein TolC
MLEMIPVQTPTMGRWQVDLFESLTTALQNRPEISQAAKEIKAACVRADVGKNELLPVLNLVLGTYVTGLEGQADMGQAWVDQFSKGRPSYSTGFTFELPFGNRAANARLQQRRLELRQAMNQLKITTASIRSEVEIAAREVDTTYREMVSKFHAMVADEAEIQYLTERWRLLPGDQQVAGVVLEDLLDAQERLANAEFGFANSLIAYNVSLMNLKKVTGTLLESQEINFGEMNVGGLPTMTVDKMPSANPARAPQVAPQGPVLFEPTARRSGPVERLPFTR